MLSASKLSYEGPYGSRGQSDVFDFYEVAEANLLNGVQSAADGASTLVAIRVAAEDTRFDPGFKVGTIVCGHPRKHAFSRI